MDDVEYERIEMERAHRMKESEDLIDDFCEHIKEIYRANVPHKGNSWMTSTPEFLYRRLQEERAEVDALMTARINTKGIIVDDRDRLADAIRKELVDEANLLWMLSERL